jgi:hypothetical protein
MPTFCWHLYFVDAESGFQEDSAPVAAENETEDDGDMSDLRAADCCQTVHPGSADQGSVAGIQGEGSGRHTLLVGG